MNKICTTLTVKSSSGLCPSVIIFRQLKVSSNRKKFFTFYAWKNLTNFEISNFSKKIISEKKIQVHFSHSFIFLFFYNNVHVNVNTFRRDKFSDYFLSEYLSAEILENPKFFPSEIFGFQNFFEESTFGEFDY